MGRSLGRGGFGEVFEVTSKKNNRKYALKIIDTQTGVSVRDIEKEIKMIKALNHSNIIKYVDACQVNEIVGIVMQLCPRGDLDRSIRMKNMTGLFFSNDLVYNWMTQLCSALEYVHSKNLLHRDLKPANILLDDSNNLLLADFGLARIMTSAYVSSICGTRYFMAPEIASGRYDQKCDIYSLGCVFICLATTQPKPSFLERTWRKIKSRFGHGVSEMMLECISTNRQDRPSAADLMTTLRTITNE